MKITEDSLLHSGFTRKEIQKLNNNIANYGGDLDEVVHDLARRFKTLLWIFSCGILFFIYLVFFQNRMIIGMFSQEGFQY